MGVSLLSTRGNVYGNILVEGVSKQAQLGIGDA